ncbi:MAG: DUF882 domain-containing protein [Hyphomicrobiaceae bacterium]
MQKLGRYISVAARCGGIFIAASFGSALFAEATAERRIAFYNTHNKERLSIVYRRNGQYQPEAMKRINWILRDWRREEPKQMDPKLIDLAWEIHAELGSQLPIHVISGYRSAKTNAMLRRKRGGQAKRSQHLLGKALDMRFPDVPVRRLRYSALIRQRGGVGYYPTSATPFVHIDTGRVRHWPRMGRHELALLFPNGRTKHRPRKGGPVSKADARVALTKHRKMAAEVAAFHVTRAKGQLRRVVVAGAEPSRIGPFATTVNEAQTRRPLLAAQPVRQLLRESLRSERSLQSWPGPNFDERQALTRLAAFAASAPLSNLKSDRSTRLMMEGRRLPLLQAGSAGAQLLGKSGAKAQPALSHTVFTRTGNRSPTVVQPRLRWVRAPEFDEDHPEELSYRPFPVQPFLTATSSPHDPALARLVHPDSARALELLDDLGALPPLRLRRGAPQAQILWAQAFRGRAVPVNPLDRRRPRKKSISRPLGSLPVDSLVR